MNAIVPKVGKYYQLVARFGLKWLFFRAWYALSLRSGLSRLRTPVTGWERIDLEQISVNRDLFDGETYRSYRKSAAPPFFFAAGIPRCRQEVPAACDLQGVSPLCAADDLLKGIWPIFSKHIIELGFPPDWHANALTGQRVPCGVHWSALPDFGFGDIKGIWEVSRFTFAYILMRAFRRTGDGRHAEAFWNLFENWCRHNPPNQGVNWKCGQEISLRLMAACWGLYGFIEHSATTPERLLLFARFIHASALRIEANIGYAVSQQNNHGISEAVGLWTAGTLFPEFKAAARWVERGRLILDVLADALIYEDGAFAQHSVNYHRLMLHDYLWVVRLGDITGRPFGSALRDRLRTAGDFLFQLIDPEDGRVPYYGQNDGALVLPLNNCDYRDFRPVVQAVHYLCSGKRRLASGPWDEDLLWLFGSDALNSPLDVQAQSELNATEGGCRTLRTGDGMVMLRCARYRHRPGQADQLHVDLWWKGQNVAIDAGTFSYNAPAPWDNPLAHTCFHNTVTVDGRDQMERVGKFLWLPWSTAAITVDGTLAGRFKYCEAVHDGYARLKPAVRHRRGVLNIDADSWLILDRLESRDEHAYRLHWLLADFAYAWHPAERKITLQTDRGGYGLRMGCFDGQPHCSVSRAAEDSPRGWHAPYYAFKAPAVSLDMRVFGATVAMWSFFSNLDSKVSPSEGGLMIQLASESIAIMIGASETAALIQSASALESSAAPTSTKVV